MSQIVTCLMGRTPLSESGCRPTLSTAQRYASLVEPGVVFRRFGNPSRRVGDPRHCMGDEGKAAGRVPLAALPSLWSITTTSRMPPDVRFVPKADSCTAAIFIVIRSPGRRGQAAEAIAGPSALAVFRWNVGRI